MSSLQIHCEQRVSSHVVHRHRVICIVRGREVGIELSCQKALELELMIRSISSCTLTRAAMPSGDLPPMRRPSTPW